MAEFFSAKEAVELAASDADELARKPQQVLVAAAGNAVVRASGSSADITLTGLAAGQVLPLSLSHIRATGTTATLVGLF
jgi:hypothetical protein